MLSRNTAVDDAEQKGIQKGYREAEARYEPILTEQAALIAKQSTLIAELQAKLKQTDNL